MVSLLLLLFWLQPERWPPCVLLNNIEETNENSTKPIRRYNRLSFSQRGNLPRLNWLVAGELCFKRMGWNRVDEHVGV
tara:strand:+ start:10735 stop:10968 length:234 start_codon:yes stop_codon:yes gene_type:complete